MKRTFLYILLFVPLFICAKEKNQFDVPMWVTFEGKELIFPKNEYFVGFAQSKYSYKSEIASCIFRTKETAKKFLSESVKVSIKSNTDTYTVENSRNDKFSNNTNYQAKVNSLTCNELIGLRTEHYVDYESKIVYVIAYVNKAEMFSFYQNKVEKAIAIAEKGLITIDSATMNGAKPYAMQQLLLYAEELENTKDDAEMMMVISQQGKMVASKYNDICAKYLAKAEILNKSIAFFIVSEEKLHGEKSTVLSNRLAQLLLDESCTITTNESEADYVIKITATTRKATINSDYEFAYADVIYEMKNTFSGRVEAKDEFSYRSGNVTVIRAEKDALLESAKKIYDKIKDTLFFNLN